MKKKYLKTNLIGFILGGLLISGVAVYAAITFPSKDVSYENSTSGLKSTNVQGAIDELYKTCTATAGDQIIEDNNLEKDPYECRYFFTGANPNNYITFNNEKAGWRIISVGCDNTIKIMRNINVDRMVWNTSFSNDWNHPAYLNFYLNGTYYNSLTSTAQNQIVEASYYAGAVTANNRDMQDQIDEEKSIVSNVKIALPTLSECIRTTSNSNCKTLYAYSSNYETCNNNNWTFYEDNWWTMTPYSGNSGDVYYLYSNRVFNTGANFENYDVRPVVTLSSDLKITGGNGSQSNPYTLG